MKTLLICVDFSDLTDRLLNHAIRLAKAFRERIVLLHVVEPNPDFVGFETGPEAVRMQWAQTFRAEHEKIQYMEKELKKTGLKVTSLLVQGSVSDEIIKHSQHLAADMILMGTHGHGQLYHLLAGSVAEQVLKKTDIPVLLIPSKKE